METGIVIALAAASVVVLAWRMLGKAGIGRPGGKPDCGCGSCHTKKRAAFGFGDKEKIK